MEIKITDKDMEFLRMAAEKSERSHPFGMPQGGLVQIGWLLRL